MTRILMQSSDVQVGTRPVQPPMLLEGAAGEGGAVFTRARHTASLSEEKLLV